MATLTTSLEACPKRVINYQTYVKQAKKGETAFREWTLNFKRALPAPTNQHPPTYAAMIISKKKVTFALQNTSYNNISLHFNGICITLQSAVLNIFYNKTTTTRL